MKHCFLETVLQSGSSDRQIISDVLIIITIQRDKGNDGAIVQGYVKVVRSGDLENTF